MKQKLCQCGCGELANPGNEYINGHNNRGKKLPPISEETRKRMSKSQKGNKNRVGKRLSEDHKRVFTFKNHKHSILTKEILKEKSTGRVHTKEERLKMSKSLKGHKPTLLCHSEETKKKISKAHKGKPKTKEHRKKLSKPKSISTKLKMSLAAVKYLEDNRYAPRRGKNENFILDSIEENIDFSIKRNSSEIAKLTGKYPDGYIQECNLIIEVLEKHHYDNNGKLKQYDIDRECNLKSKIKCNVYYISEIDFLEDSQNEIIKLKQYIEEIKNA